MPSNPENRQGKVLPIQSVRYSHLAFWQEGTIFFLGWKTIYQKDLRLV